MGYKVTPDKGKICFKSKKKTEVFKFSSNPCKFPVFNDLASGFMVRYVPAILVVLILLTACKEMPVDKPTEPQCIDGQSHCIVSQKFGNVSILFNRDKLVAEQPFELTLRFENSHAVEQVFAHMEGEDMYMGKIPLFFEQKSPGVYVANGLFGSCGQTNMIWRVWFTVTAKSKQQFSITIPSFQHQ